MNVETHSRQNPRLLIFYILFCALFIILAGGLGWRQIVQGETFREQERRQNFRRILIPGPRGNIFDRDRNLLVGNRPLFSAVVYLNELRPEFRQEYIRLVRELRDTNSKLSRSELQSEARRIVVQRELDTLNRILGREEKVNLVALDRHFAQNLLLPLPLISDLKDYEYARLIEQLPVDGPLQILTDTARYYPNGSMAAHTLGYVTSSDELPSENLPGEELMTFRFKGRVGRAGLERQFDETLQGVTGGEIWVVDPSGFQYERTAYAEPIKGQDLYTSIDLNLQRTAETQMNRYIGAAVALDINSGEILAMASKPDYNLNQLSPFIPTKVHNEITENGAWINRATQGLYPPGSTFKIITTIAGMQQGIMGETVEIECPGHYMVGNRRFYCHNRNGHGMETIEEAIRDSCNVYYYSKSLEMGALPIATVARAFGLDRPTGVELPAEAKAMIVSDPEWKRNRFNEQWYAGDTANLSIGQGFLRNTPLQMAAFTAAFARRETLIRPTLLQRPKGSTLPRSTPLALSDSDYQRIIEGMKMSANSGTGRLIALRDIEIAAKTGTAQVWSQGKELTIAWTIAFAPVENPRLAIAVAIEGTDPSDNYHGGSTAAPVAREIFRTYFQKYGY